MLEILLSTGFVIGLLHAFEPDHMTAMMTQVKYTDSKISIVKNSLLGAMWGFGHTSMILVVSVVVFVLAYNVPSIIFDGFEFLVGMMLVILGIFMYKKAHSHSHPHSHGNIIHIHPHSHDKNHLHTHKSYLVGCLHGLAGSGSLVALSMVTTSDMIGIVSFVLIFGLGSIIGMMIFGGTISIPFHTSLKFIKLKYLHIISGTITIIIGLHIIYHTSDKLVSFFHVI